MASYGLRVPEGFILTTELFGAMPAMSYRPLYADTVQRVQTGAGPAREADRPAPRRPRAPAAPVHPLGGGHVHARPHDHVRQRGPQRRAGRGAGGRAAARMGGLGLLSALPADVGHVRRHRPRLLRRHHRRVQGALRRRAEARLHDGADARDRPRLQAARQDEGVVFVDDPFDQVVACIFKVLESWDSARPL